MDSGTVKNAALNYLRKRKYTEADVLKNGKSDFSQSPIELISQYLLDNDVSQSNSITFNYTKCNIAQIDNELNRLKLWIFAVEDDEIKEELKEILFPLFVHLYLESLGDGVVDDDTTKIFKRYEEMFLSSFDSYKEILTELANLQTTKDMEQFPLTKKLRSRKFQLYLSPPSLDKFTQYLAENCEEPMLFLNVLKSWFTIDYMPETGPLLEDIPPENEFIPSYLFAETEDENEEQTLHDMFKDDYDGEDIHDIISGISEDSDDDDKSTDCNRKPVDKDKLKVLYDKCELSDLSANSTKKFLEFLDNNVDFDDAETVQGLLEIAESAILKPKVNPVSVWKLYHSDSVCCGSFSTSTETIATGSMDSKIQLWNIDDDLIYEEIAYLSDLCSEEDTEQKSSTELSSKDVHKDSKKSPTSDEYFEADVEKIADVYLMDTNKEEILSVEDILKILDDDNLNDVPDVFQTTTTAAATDNSNSPEVSNSGDYRINIGLDDNHSADNIDLDNIPDNMELGNLADNMELDNLTDNIELGNLTDNMELANLTDNMELGNLTDNMELANLTDNMELSNLTDNIELDSALDNLELSNVIDNSEFDNTGLINTADNNTTLESNAADDTECVLFGDRDIKIELNCENDDNNAELNYENQLNYLQKTCNEEGIKLEYEGDGVSGNVKLESNKDGDDFDENVKSESTNNIDEDVFSENVKLEYNNKDDNDFDGNNDDGATKNQNTDRDKEAENKYSAEDENDEISDDTSEDDPDYSFVTMRGHHGPVSAVKLIEELGILVSVSHDKTMRVWDLSTYTCRSIYMGHSEAVWCLDVNVLNTYVATGSRDKTALLWNFDRTDPLRVFVGHLNGISCVKFHPNAAYLATASTDHTVRLFTVSDGTNVRLFLGHSCPVYCLSFSPDGCLLASGDRGKKVIVWDVASAQKYCVINLNRKRIASLNWTIDSKVIAITFLKTYVMFYLIDEKTKRKPKARLIKTAVRNKAYTFIQSEFIRKNTLSCIVLMKDSNRKYQSEVLDGLVDNDEVDDDTTCNIEINDNIA